MKTRKYDVEFSGGQSRYGTGAVNYMLVDCIPTNGASECDANVQYASLYAEVPAGDDDEDYDTLKAEIIDQAKEKNIPVEQLHFMYD